MGEINVPFSLLVSLPLVQGPCFEGPQWKCGGPGEES